MARRRSIEVGGRARVQPLIDQVVQAIRGHVKKGSLKVYLFGSWSQGRALSVSDLDIAIDAGKPLELQVMSKLVEGMMQLPTLRKIDIVDLWAVDDEFRQRVLQQGELLYAR